MQLELTHVEIRTIEEAVKKHRKEMWENRAKTIIDKSFENVQELYKEFIAIDNSFTEEGVVNNILKKIEEYDKKLIKGLGGG